MIEPITAVHTDVVAAASTVESLVYSLRKGIGALVDPDNQRRLSELRKEQLCEVCERVQKFKPNIATAWTPTEAKGLITIWRKIRG